MKSDKDLVLYVNSSTRLHRLSDEKYMLDCDAQGTNGNIHILRAPFTSEQQAWAYVAQRLREMNQ